MIQSVLIFNTHGKPRLSKFYIALSPQTQQALLSQIFSLIQNRPSAVCNFLDAPDLVFPSSSGSGSSNGKGKGKAGAGDRDNDSRVIYRHYATLYFVFVVDGAESELGILDLIQVFVESLDRAFENVCELDLIFHFDQVHHVLSEIIQGGLVLETNINEITANVRASALNRKLSAASAVPLVPLALGGGGGGGGGGVGGALGGGATAAGMHAKRWLAGLGVGG